MVSLFKSGLLSVHSQKAYYSQWGPVLASLVDLLQGELSIILVSCAK